MGSVPRIGQGLLNLRQWQAAGYTTISLSGTWDFVPGKLISADTPRDQIDWVSRQVPDLWDSVEAGASWGQGFGTYRLRIFMPPGVDHLAIRVPTVSTACEIEANGKLIYRAGHPGPSAAEAVPRFLPGIADLPHDADEIELLVRVSNWDYRSGGMWRAFSLGTRDNLDSDKRLADLLAILLGAALLATGLNSLVLFLFRHSEQSYMWFSVFVLAMSLRTTLTGEYLLSQLLTWIHFTWLIRMEYLTVFINLPTISLFFLSFFPGVGRRFDRWLLVTPSLVFMALALFLPLPLLTRSLFWYYPLALGCIGWLFYRLILPATRARIQGSLLMLIGSLVLCLTAINDALFASFVLPVGNLMPIGLVVFISFQATVMAKRFTGAFSRTEQLTAELAESNRRLNAELDERSHIQTSLVNLLSEKNLLIKEIHHRVKNSLQIVSSIIGLQSKRQNDTRTIELLTTLRIRIRAISLVHEKLYGQTAAAQVDIGGYVRDLVTLFISSFGSARHQIRLLPFDQRIDAPIEFCIDFGLILTELVANSIKHGGQDADSIEITISLEYEAGVFTCRIHDNGPGFPDKLDTDNAKTLGYQMIRRQLERSQGTLAIQPGNGAQVTVTMRLESAGLPEGAPDVVSQD